MKDDASSDGAVLESTRMKRDIPPAHYTAHYTLKINSFSQLSEIVRKSGVDKYESSDFEVDGYKWKLVLYPEGNAKRNGNYHISLYLALAETNAISHGCQITVTLKFFIYDHTGDTYVIIQDGIEKCYHALKTENGLHRLLPLVTFNDPRNGYLVDDCCAFGVEVHVIKCKGIGEEVSFVMDPQGGSYTWKIQNFSILNQNHYSSEIFTAANCKWKLSLYPTGSLREKDACLSLFLNLEGSSAPLKHKVFVEYTLTAKDQVNGRHHERKSNGRWFSNSVPSWGFPNFLLLIDLYNVSKGFLVNDSLIVEAKITRACTVQGLS